MCFENSFDAYPYKNQDENPSNVMIVNLYKSIVTEIFVNYQLPQETLCICRNFEVVTINKSDSEQVKNDVDPLHECNF